MRVQVSVPAYQRSAQDAAVPEKLLEAVFRALSAPLSAAVPVGDHPNLPPLLNPGQVVELMGIDRMVKVGDLPWVMPRKGPRQRVIRIPKAFVLAMIADLNAGRSIPVVEGLRRPLAGLSSRTPPCRVRA